VYWSLGKIWDERRANVTLMAAVVAVPLFGLVFSAVDFARYSSAQSQLRTVLSDGIERARLLGGQDLITAAVQTYVVSNIDGHISPESVEIIVPDAVFDEAEGGVVARARMKTQFLRYIGIESLELSETVPAHFAPDLLIDITISALPTSGSVSCPVLGEGAAK